MSPIRPDSNALLPLNRVDGDAREIIMVRENDGTGYFAHFYSKGTEIVSLTVGGILKLCNVILSCVGAGILHSDSSGHITSGPVSLTAEVTGTLPIANGGTNATSAAAALTNLGGIGWSTFPAHFNSPGTAGQIAYDPAGNLYVCYATNAWSKFAGSVIGW